LVFIYRIFRLSHRAAAAALAISALRTAVIFTGALPLKLLSSAR
jgi:hypothetical protein